ncbi:MAG: DUF3794 domain-containing protein [Candidatus Improbicoccus devescovinae]|nr:MAG: DUF3794 domain-containing protein [Candidatus Improbicoccus devescovinae]
MNYNISKTAFCALDNMFNAKDEIPIDFDFTLPDYCPDIGRILKCQVTPVTLVRNLNVDRLNTEGIVRVELLYLELDKNILRCYKTESPFSHNFDLKSEQQGGIAFVESKLDYVNCRALTPRRLDIHGAFSLRAIVYAKQNLEPSVDILGEDIQQLTSEVEFSNLLSINQNPVSISEVLDLGSDRADVEFIIRSEAWLNVESCKCTEGKINIKASVIVKILYVSDMASGKLENIDYEIPVNQVFDAPEAGEDSKCIVRAQIVNHDEKISSEQDNSNLINLDLKLLFTMFLFEDQNEKILTDIYSLDYDLEVAKENINAQKFEGSSHESFVQKAYLDLIDTKILKIMDVWSDGIRVVLDNKFNQPVMYNGKVNICIIALDSNSVPFYLEREIDFSKEAASEYNLNFNEISCTANLNSIGYKIGGNDNKIELKLEITVDSDVFSIVPLTFVNEAFTDESKPKIKDDNGALTVYYANQGESVWDISKKYNTTVDKIKEENEIDSDVLDCEKAILIPIS